MKSKIKADRSPEAAAPAGVSSFSPAFSLIELLVVIAIFGIMAAVTLPALGSLNKSGGINRAGALAGDQIILARQEAAARNRDVEVRVIDVPDPVHPGYRAIQLWLVDDTGTNKSPLGKVQRLPEGVAISADPSLSPLLSADTNVSGTTNFGAFGSRTYKGFRIRSSGAPTAAINTTNNFLTIHSLSDSNIPPANFYAVRVNPITGRVTIHRP